MRGALVALLLASQALAQAPDAPVAPSSLVLKAGEVAPADGVWLSDAQAKLAAQAVVDGEARPGWVVVVVAGVACLTGGVVAGWAIARSAK